MIQSVMASFGLGAFPGLEDVPDGGVSDIVNGVLRDDGAIGRRGGTVAKAGPIPEAMTHIWDGFLPRGRRTVMQAADGSLYRLDPTNESMIQGTGAPPVGYTTSVFTGRARSFAGMWMRAVAISVGDTQGAMVALYGGSPIESFGGRAGTITLTQGSKAVVGVGTALDSYVWDGQLLVPATTGGPTVAVESTTDATHATLVEPWPYATATGVGWSSGSVIHSLVQAATGLRGEAYLAVAGGRVFLCKGNKILMSNFEVDGNGTSRSTPTRFAADEYHQLPDGAALLGAEALNDAVVAFTSAGVWVVTNPALELTDPDGNAQQALIQVNRDMLLWGDQGIATFQNTLLVPAVDDVFLFTTSADAPQNQVRAITGGARKQYREFVEEGYRPGQAAVFRGTYVLPILDQDGAPVTAMTWRVDQLGPGGAPYQGRWTGRAGQAAALAIRTGDPLREPQLLAVVDTKVEDFTSVLSPASTVESDATGDFDFEVTYRPMMAAEARTHTIRSMRMRYELETSTSAELSIEASADGVTWVLVDPPTTETGRVLRSWLVNRTGQQVWLRSRLEGPASSFVVRGLEVDAELGRS